MEPDNETAKFELNLLDKIIELDGQITLEQMVNLKQCKPRTQVNGAPEEAQIPISKDGKRESGCMGINTSAESMCSIF